VVIGTRAGVDVPIRKERWGGTCVRLSAVFGVVAVRGLVVVGWSLVPESVVGVGGVGV
jgi:hypothetical protein